MHCSRCMDILGRIDGVCTVDQANWLKTVHAQTWNQRVRKLTPLNLSAISRLSIRMKSCMVRGNILEDSRIVMDDDDLPWISGSANVQQVMLQLRLAKQFYSQNVVGVQHCICTNIIFTFTFKPLTLKRTRPSELQSFEVRNRYEHTHVYAWNQLTHDCQPRNWLRH